MSEGIVRYEPPPAQIAPLAASDLVAQVHLIQEVMRAVMKDGGHYGKIPGCGDKPTLLKPGAEKLAMTFRLAPEFEILERDLGNWHREYRVDVKLYTIPDHIFVGSGTGSCSTLEAKYRFRTGPVELTGRPVPKEYWDLRKTDAPKAQELIGGRGFTTKKNPDTGGWEIAIAGEKVEHDNPADYYNTVLKMAKKRGLVDAVLTSTAASDIFTQDVEDMVENGVAPKPEPKPAPKAEPKPEGAPETPRPRLVNDDGSVRKMTDAQIKRMWALSHKHGVSEESLADFIQIEMGFEKPAEIPIAKAEDLFKWIESHPVAADGRK